MSGMGYPPRKEEAGAVHHVYSRGIARRAIFLDNEDRRTYLAMLGTVALRCRWHCLAFCLMDNHVHQLIETPVPNLVRLHFMEGKEIPWSVVLITSVFSVRPAASKAARTSPTA